MITKLPRTRKLALPINLLVMVSNRLLTITQEMADADLLALDGHAHRFCMILEMLTLAIDELKVQSTKENCIQCQQNNKEIAP